MREVRIPPIQQGVQDNWFVTRIRKWKQDRSPHEYTAKMHFPRATFTIRCRWHILYSLHRNVKACVTDRTECELATHSIVRVAEQANIYIYILSFSFKNARERGRRAIIPFSCLSNVDAQKHYRSKTKNELSSFTVIGGSRIYAGLSKPAVAPPFRDPGDAAGGPRCRWRSRRSRPRHPRAGCGGRDDDDDGSPRDAYRGDSDGWDAAVAQPKPRRFDRLAASLRSRAAVGCSAPADRVAARLLRRRAPRRTRGNRRRRVDPGRSNRAISRIHHSWWDASAGVPETTAFGNLM